MDWKIRAGWLGVDHGLSGRPPAGTLPVGQEGQMNEQDLSNQIRQYVDGELDPEQGAPLSDRIESDKDLQARTRFERALRDRVSRALLDETGRAPEGLAEQIRSALAEVSAEPEVAGRVDPSRAQPPTVGTDEEEPGEVRRPWYAGPQRINLLAVAAVVTLITSVVLFSIFSPQIDDSPRPTVSDFVCLIGEFTTHVHGLCADDPTIMAMKSAWPTFSDAELNLARHLGAEAVTVVDLGAVGYEFLGAGKCHVPGTDPAGREVPSGHAVYRRRGAAENRPESMVSVFMAPNVGQFSGHVEEFEPGQWYEIVCGVPEGQSVHRLTDGSLIYVLVCGDVRSSEAVRRAVAQGLARASGNG